MIKKLALAFCLLFLLSYSAHSQDEKPVPFSTNNQHLTVWNGKEYIPFFIKGVNLGVAIPGTFPGELAATKEDYFNWFSQIKAAGFNSIRLYTLHYPRFYEALSFYNEVNPKNPLVFIQGVWLNEENPGYNHDLVVLTDTFRTEIQENIDAVHGNINISERQGKAYGNYTWDVSEYCMAYIIGREVHPFEIETTNQNNNETSYQGNHFSINEASASEVWISKMLDELVSYENQTYQTQRPVSFSSWPTLDPLTHEEEINDYEDSQEIDLSKLQKVNAPAGFFISYHAYPYYPDFISKQSSYQTFSDKYGPNSYLGYLYELKTHYPETPLIIAEFGVPSSWAIAHYASSGMNHGGFDEYEQGNTNIRLLKNIEESGAGGGISFAWIDEWFKRTWISDKVDFNPEDRILWHNISSAEQNFGLISFEKEKQFETIKTFPDGEAISAIRADAGYSFLEIEISINEAMDVLDEFWIAIDTYDSSLGESILPSGDTIPEFRAEFALKISNYKADLFVTQAYDLYGNWHNQSSPEQVYQSVTTDGGIWNIVRLKNNYSNSDVQYTGSMGVVAANQPVSSKDAVIIREKTIQIRLPWSYLNFVAPNKLKVMHDDKNSPETELRISDGIAFSIRYKDQWFQTDQRFVWEEWNRIDPESLTARFKTSYWIMQDRLPEFNTNAIAVNDRYSFLNASFPFTIDAEEGLLQNDFDLDGDYLVSLLESPLKNGSIELNNDGSFSYQPNAGFTGFDTLSYFLYDGHSLSASNQVVLYVDQNNSTEELFIPKEKPWVYASPNPAKDYLLLQSAVEIQYIEIFDMQGKVLLRKEIQSQQDSISVSGLPTGIYIVICKLPENHVSLKFVKQ